MKVLIIGDASHSLINDTVKTIKDKKKTIVIDILSLTNDLSNLELVGEIFYDNIFYFPISNSILMKFPIIRGLYKILLHNKKGIRQIKNSYDICHIHYVKYKHFFLLKEIFKIADTLIVSIWGNDYNKSNYFKKRLIHVIMKKSIYITYGYEPMKKKILKDFPDLGKKLKEYNFAKNNLQELFNKKQLSKNHAKELINIKPETLVITCGYTSKGEQRQIEIITALEKINLPKNYLLIFPMTYGNFRKNISKIKGRLSHTKFKYRIYEKFLPNEEVALLRKASDIMISIVPQDQMNSSMIEYIYAENILITGEWLPYSKLDQIGIYYHKIKRISELSDKIDYCIKNLEYEKKLIINNKDKIEKEFIIKYQRNFLDLYLRVK